MIKPHGSDALHPLLISDPDKNRVLASEAEDLPSLLLNSAAAANVVMLGGGYFTPLNGFMDVTDAMSVAKTMHTTDSLFWPVPILNLTSDVSGIEAASRIALRDPNVAGNPVLAVLSVKKIERLTQEQIEEMTGHVFGTVDRTHPGVAVFSTLGEFCVSGDVEVLNLSYFENDFPETFKTAVEIRREIETRRDSP